MQGNTSRAVALLPERRWSYNPRLTHHTHRHAVGGDIVRHILPRLPKHQHEELYSALILCHTSKHAVVNRSCKMMQFACHRFAFPMHQ